MRMIKLWDGIAEQEEDTALKLEAVMRPAL